MKKKIIWYAFVLILVIIVAVPTSFLYILSNGNPYTKYIANKKVPSYLKEKGYVEDDFKKAHYIEPKHGTNKNFYNGHYMVIFKDEPDVIYYYGITKEEKQVKQFCERDKLSAYGTYEGWIEESKTKHSEVKCSYGFGTGD